MNEETIQAARRAWAHDPESSPNSERWPEAKADMQKGFAELQGIYKKLKK